MNQEQPTSFIGLISRNWWMLALRGLVAVLFGVFAFAWPKMALLTLVMLFGTYALVDGILALVTAFRAPKGYPRFGRLIFHGVLGIVAGVLAFAWPGITAMALLFMIAGWAILTGLMEITEAVELRKVLAHEWMLIAAGIVSVLFGIALLARPVVGALAVLWLIGAFAIVFGLLCLALSFRVRRWEHPAPPAAGPTPA